MGCLVTALKDMDVVSARRSPRAKAGRKILLLKQRLGISVEVGSPQNGAFPDVCQAAFKLVSTAYEVLGDEGDPNPDGWVGIE